MADLDALEAELRSGDGRDDVRHMKRMIRWGRACSAVGYGTCWIAINPVSIVAISLGAVARWTIVSHHLCHRAFDKNEHAPAAWDGRRFGRGLRRFVDWLDWMPTDAWHQEHDLDHHYKLGETEDPDAAEYNTDWLRRPRIPMVFRLAFVALMALIWKPTYYAANTVNAHHNARERRAGTRTERMLIADRRVWLPWHPRGRDLWLRAWLPNVAWRFALPIGLAVAFAPPSVAVAIAVNLLAAELLANAHGFGVVVPNHTGSDLYRFENPAASRGEFLLRQVLGSCDFRCGGDVNDFLHGFLNYQVEHHLWPDLTPRQLQRAHAGVKRICAAHGVPFVQESVWTRAAKMVRVLVGLDAPQVVVPDLIRRPSRNAISNA